MEVSENPGLLKRSNDPVVIATGYKKNRFYLFTSREPDMRYLLLIKLPIRNYELLFVIVGYLWSLY